MTLSLSLERATLRSQPALIGGSGGSENFLTLNRKVSQPRCGCAPWIWKGGDVSLSSHFLGDVGVWLRHPFNLCLDQFCLLDGLEILMAVILAKMELVSLPSTSSTIGGVGCFTAGVFGLGDVGRELDDEWVVQVGLGSDPIRWDRSIFLVAKDNMISGDLVYPSMTKIAARIQLNCDDGDGDLSPMLDCAAMGKTVVVVVRVNLLRAVAIWSLGMPGFAIGLQGCWASSGLLLMVGVFGLAFGPWTSCLLYGSLAGHSLIEDPHFGLL